MYNFFLDFKVDLLATGQAITLEGEKEVIFLSNLATVMKVSGSTDGGSTYNDLAGTSQTVLVAEIAGLSLLKPRFDHLKVTLTGAGATCLVLSRHLRKSAPTQSADVSAWKQIIDPPVGTA